MGKYTTLTEKYAERFKRVIQAQTGINLEDIVFETFQGDFLMQAWYNTIWVNEYYLKEQENNEKGVSGKLKNTVRIIYATMHELFHLVHYQLLYNKIEEIKSKNSNSEMGKICESLINLDCEKWYASFLEGFSTYAEESFYPRSICDHQTKMLLRKKDISIRCDIGRFESLHMRNYSFFDKKIESCYKLCYNPYEKGYKFFNSVVYVLQYYSHDLNKIFELATNPPLSEEEILNPIKYLLRAYPKELRDPQVSDRLASIRRSA